MSTGTVILLVVVLVVVAAGAALASMAARGRAGRQSQGGAEFGRLARERGSRRARAEFASRRRRVNGMGIKPLSDERRSAYELRWTAVQEQFIDSPAQAAATAAGLVTAVAAERGYDVGDCGQLLADLSVYHGRYLEGYRRAVLATEQGAYAATEDGYTPTEDLRQALLDHRALFQDLLENCADSSRADGEPDAVGRGAWRQVMPPLHRGSRQRRQDDVAAMRSLGAACCHGTVFEQR